MASYSCLPPESHLPRRLFGAMPRRIAALPLHRPPSHSGRTRQKKHKRRRLGVYFFRKGKTKWKFRGIPCSFSQRMPCARTEEKCDTD